MRRRRLWNKNNSALTNLPYVQTYAGRFNKGYKLVRKGKWVDGDVAGCPAAHTWTKYWMVQWYPARQRRGQRLIKIITSLTYFATHQTVLQHTHPAYARRYAYACIHYNNYIRARCQRLHNRLIHECNTTRRANSSAPCNCRRRRVAAVVAVAMQKCVTITQRRQPFYTFSLINQNIYFFFKEKDCLNLNSPKITEI